MAVLLADPRTAAWSSPRGGGSFQPQGSRRNEHLLPPPPGWGSGSVFAARLFVGLRREGERRFDLEQLVELAREVRAAQVGPASSSFVAQLGTFRSRRGRDPAKPVPAAQLIVIDMDRAPERFERCMVELAEAIARRSGQLEVVVQLQRNGLSQKFMGVSGD